MCVGHEVKQTRYCLDKTNKWHWNADLYSLINEVRELEQECLKESQISK